MDRVDRRRVRTGVLLLLICLATLPSAASQVRAVNLEQMTERAARIFAGRCLETSVTFDPEAGGEVLTATFEVSRAVKGHVGDTATVRMLRGARDGADGLPGMPRLRPGDDVVLFLYGDSDLGLTSPVGLGQGRFAVIEDKRGRKLAINDLANRNLLRGLSPRARARLGATFERWSDRKDVDPAALLDMAESLTFAAGDR